MEGLQGHSLKEIYRDFKLARLNSLDISLSVRLKLWNLPEIPLREERGKFDKMFEGSEWRKPQRCQVYAPLSSACSMNQLFLLYCKNHRLWARDWSS